MQALADWVRLIIIVAAITTLAKAVLPEGNTRHYVELILGLVMLATLLQPLLHIVHSSYNASSTMPAPMSRVDTEELIRRGQQLGSTGVDAVLQGETSQVTAHVESLLLLVDEVDRVGVDAIYWNDHAVSGIVLRLEGREGTGDSRVKRLLAAFLGVEERAVHTTWSPVGGADHNAGFGITDHAAGGETTGEAGAWVRR